MQKVYAGIGSRKRTPDEWKLCYDIGKWLAEQGWTLRTGAAEGTDQAFAEGALSVGGSVMLCLPWPSYNFKWVEPARGRGANSQLLQYFHKEAWESVNLYHPKHERLSSYARALHARNWLIIKPTSFVIAWPDTTKPGLGGTGQGLRIAAGLNRTTIRLDEPIDRKKVTDKVYP